MHDNETHGEFPETGTVVFRRLLPGPIKRVWEYLTDSEKRGLWLAQGEMELRVGGKVELRFDHDALSPEPETVPEKYCNTERYPSFTGHVTVCEPPYRLAYTWAESWGKDSEVTFELTPEGDKVHLLLTHRRLSDQHETQTSVAAGWHTHLRILIDRLENHDPAAFWKEHSQREEEYARLLASKETMRP